MFISLALTSGAATGAAGQHKGRHFALKIALAVLAVGTALAGTASAQTPTTGPTSENYRRVASACTAEYATFCAAGSSEPMTGREPTMCLKYHKLDLSLGYRGAVNAATAAQ